MLVVKVKDGNIERALKQFKRKFNECKVMKELRDRQVYEKPSVTRRNKKKHAEYVQKRQDVSED